MPEYRTRSGTPTPPRSGATPILDGRASIRALPAPRGICEAWMGKGATATRCERAGEYRITFQIGARLRAVLRCDPHTRIFAARRGLTMPERSPQRGAMP